MIWLGYAALTLISVGILVWPIMRNAGTAAQETEADQALYQGQLKEVEGDVANGLLTNSEAETARTEIKRRLLAANRRATGDKGVDAPMARMSAVTGIAVLVPFCALAVYVTIGAPGLPSAPVEQRRADALVNPENTDFGVLIEDLADRLRQNPESTEGWVLLARSYRQINRLEDAATAYRRALATGSNDIDIYTEFGDTLTAMNGGTVPPEAADVFRAVLRTDRDEPRARFYLGLAAAQAGNVADSIAIWRDLTANAASDAPWLAMVRDQMSQVAMAANIMPMTIAPRHPLDGPTTTQSTVDSASTVMVPEADEDDFRPDVSALADRFSGGEMTMIQEMVGGLEARLEFEPDDFEGWMQLARSYSVLGNTEKSAGAYRKASALNTDAIEPRAKLAETLVRAVEPGAPIPNEVNELTNEILALDQNNPDGLFISGLAAADAGQFDLARDRWTALLGLLPPGDTAYESVSRRLAALPNP